MNIYLTKSLQNKIQQRAETNKYINQGINVFRTIETPKSSIWKQLKIKILGSHSRFQKFQIDKQKTHLYLKLCN